MSTAVAKTNGISAQIKQFEAEVDLRTATFQQALPDHVPVDKFKRALVTAVVQNPDLLNCTRSSLFKASMAAAASGLILDRVVSHAHILPYKNTKKGIVEAQLIVDYRGYIHLARQSGEISNVQASEVCANDEFTYVLGLEPKLEHRPALTDRGEVIAAYCVARFKDGSYHLEVMSRSDIDRSRNRSRSKDRGPWASDYLMMARKTVIRRAARYLPLSVQRVAALDAAYDARQGVDVDHGELIIDADATEDAVEETGAIVSLDQYERGPVVDAEIVEPEPPPAHPGETEPQASQEPQSSAANEPGGTLPVQPAESAGPIPDGLDRRDSRSPEEWMKAAHKLIDDLKASNSLKAYEVLARSQRFVNTLAAMKEAGANKQIDAVVGYQEERRRELEAQ